MGTVLIAWELGGGLGHCSKLAPLAAGLLEKGHRIVFASRDVITAQQVMAGLEVTHLQAPVLLAKPVRPVEQPSNFAHILHNTGFGDDRQLSALITSWRQLLDLIRPDLVVCEHAPLALLASRIQHLRRVVIGTGFSLPPAIAPLPELREQRDQDPNGLSLFERKILERVNRLLLQAGCPPLDRLGDLYGKADARFLMSFPELDHHPLRDETEYWGVCSSACGGPVEWPEGSGPRIFAYLKPTAGNWKVGPTLGLLSELPARTIAYVPDERLNSHAAPSLRICTSPVDLDALAQDCQVAILNGTAGAGTQLLLAGVPLLLIPLFLEQVAFSRRVVAMGAGLMADPSRPEQIAARLLALLQDARFRDGARRFAARYVGFDPGQQQLKIVERIEGLLNHDGSHSRMPSVDDVQASYCETHADL
jgi:UDP:flavonoid glycosyltransferase YjiC (YdhE family)